MLDDSTAEPGHAFTPGRAYWNQRARLGAARDRLLTLSRTVGRPSDLAPYQFAQLVAGCLEFKPDLILELGRGFGNSTCAFTEAANQLGGVTRTRVVSLCKSREWDILTRPALTPVVGDSWFAPLEALTTDILTFDYRPHLSGAQRVIVFWDAHGFEIAECVLGTILPLLADRAHLVFMHDLSDVRYCPPSLADYGEHGMWKGENAGDARLRIGIVDSAVAQAISVIDFSGRNNITLDSADHSFDVDLAQYGGRADQMRELLGDELFGLQGHWFWFTLNERPGPYTFPKLKR
jgi:hypothetical protein